MYSNLRQHFFWLFRAENVFAIYRRKWPTKLSLSQNLIENHFVKELSGKMLIKECVLSLALSLFCQVGDDVIRLCKICGGYQIRVLRSIHSINFVPHDLDSNIRVRSFFFLHNGQYYVSQNSRLEAQGIRYPSGTFSFPSVITLLIFYLVISIPKIWRV